MNIIKNLYMVRLMMVLGTKLNKGKGLYGLNIVLVVIICAFHLNAQIINPYTYSRTDSIKTAGDDYMVPNVQIINPYTYSRTDSIKTAGDDYMVLGKCVYSLAIEKKIDSVTDSIFLDSYNQFSRLLFFRQQKLVFDVPTIPLSNVVYLKDRGVIIGLSNIQLSPYHIVIYDTSGVLLYKGVLGALMLKMNISDVEHAITLFPDLYSALFKFMVFKDAGFYYIPLAKDIYKKVGWTNFLGKLEGKYIANPLVPDMGPVNPSFGRYAYYIGPFSKTDPIIDLIKVGSVPYVLILRGEKGETVNLPLISNCDIIRDIEVHKGNVSKQVLRKK